jgi:hypothetical protein
MAVKQERDTTPLQDVRRQLFLEQAQEKTSALQRAQLNARVANRKRTRTTRAQQETILTEGGIPVSKISSSGNACDWAGCQRRFKKKEHLKRHILS